MSYVDYHPVWLNLCDQKVLIVGGGFVAVEKLTSLLPVKPCITVVSPVINDEVRAWVESGEIHWIEKEFEESDVEPYYMVIAATNNPAVNTWVYQCGHTRNKLTNSVDDPEHCNFIMSANTGFGPLKVAISSAGCSPAIAQKVRNRIASEIISEELGRLTEFVGDRRQRVKAALTDYKVKQAFWEGVVNSEVADLVGKGRIDEAEEIFSEMLSEAVAGTSAAPASAEGKVFLVGAGPGDKGLITVRGQELLRDADAVMYDRLVNPDLLRLMKPGAEAIYVGKEVGHRCDGKVGRQTWINDVLIEHARLGRKVVRLKGGDPFVFGRGGEELIALAEAGIAFEVVPGVSSAVAGPASAQIPLTHRGVSTAFAVFAGQEAEGRDELPWAAAAQIPTAVFLMGVERLPVITSQLIANGRDPSTPVAIVSHATLETQKVVEGRLDDIVAKSAGIPAPSVIVVGEVVRVRSQLKTIVATTAGYLV